LVEVTEEGLLCTTLPSNAGTYNVRISSNKGVNLYTLSTPLLLIDTSSILITDVIPKLIPARTSYNHFAKLTIQLLGKSLGYIKSNEMQVFIDDSESPVNLASFEVQDSLIQLELWQWPKELLIIKI
jgi:hypothetical protein